MFHPIGGLPPRTYWWRRTVLCGALLMSAVLIKTEVLDGSSDAATTAEQTPTRHTRAAPTPDPAPLRLITPGTTAPTAAATTAHATGPSVTSTSAPAPGRTPVRTSAQPRPIGTCPEGELTLQVSAGAPAYRLGEIPVIRYVVTNRSATVCKRDLGEAVQEALVWKGATRLWSSNDCWPGTEHRVVTLRPDRPDRFTMRWSRMSSLPQCHGIRRVVPAGTYTLIGRVGNLMGRAPIRLR